MDRVSVHARLKRIVHDMNRQFFVAGGLLTQVQEHKLWEDVKATSFTDYCERQLDISYTTAHKWMAVYNGFRHLNFPQHLIIGPTKMYMMIGRVNQENVKDLLIWARDHNLIQCRRRFNRKAPRDRSIAFWVSEDEADRIMDKLYSGLEAGVGPTLGATLDEILRHVPVQLLRKAS